MEDLKHIIKASINGDEKAQRALYENYRTRWYMLSMRYGKNKMQGEDIFQEGMIQIYNDLNQYDSTKSGFSTWSSRIIVHTALRYLKKHNWANSFSNIEETYDIVDDNDSVFGQIAIKEMTLMLQKLPLGYRLVFNLYAIEGYSHKEIASQLSITVGTSKSQLSKARKQLRHVLESQLNVSKHG